MITKEEMEYINSCGPIVGFEEKKGLVKEDKKK